MKQEEALLKTESELFEDMLKDEARMASSVLVGLFKAILIHIAHFTQ